MLSVLVKPFDVLINRSKTRLFQFKNTRVDFFIELFILCLFAAVIFAEN